MGFEIPLDSDYFDHPKVIKLITKLGKRADVFPLRLFAWAAKFAKDGTVDDAEQLERACRWDGKPGVLHAAMVECGVIDPDGKTIHDWMHYAGGKLAAYEKKRESQRAAYRKKSGGIPPPSTSADCGNSAGRIPAESRNTAELPLETKRNETKQHETKPNETASPPDFEMSDLGLAQEFCFYSTAHVGIKKRDAPDGISPMIGALVKTGVSRQAIRDEIRNRERDTNEWFSDFSKRLKPNQKAKNNATNEYRYVEGRDYGDSQSAERQSAGT